MQIGVVFPQTEIGADVGAVRSYAEHVQGLGYRHVLVYDHVVGADPHVHRGWSGPYDVSTTFHEPMVLFGFLAGVTSLELVTGVIILPQRQTALVAKQAAEIDLLTEGRFRFGVGVGWNAVEYEALGKDFSNRGRRSEEQIELLRQFWTQQSVTHDGRYERVTGAGISPMPIQRPIPVWFGASSPAAYARAGRLGDGWFPQMGPSPEFDLARKAVEHAAAEAGRDPGSLGLQGTATFKGEMAELIAKVESWRAVGATHVGINTMGAGLGGVEGHLAVLTEVADELGLTGSGR